MRHRRRKIILGIVVILVAALIAGRIYLPFWLTDYVNNVLNNIKGYKGSIVDVDVHLYRGAYTIHKLKISKENNGVPVPFFESELIDLSLQWGALFRGRIVSDVDFHKPVVNFAVNRSGKLAQTGEEVDWTKPLKELAPFDINLVTFDQGKVTFKNFSTNPNVDVDIHDLRAEVRNLRNVEDKDNALPSPIKVSGTSMGKGKFQLDGKLNILRPTPDMDLNIKLENANLTAFNDYSKAYALVDFEKGTLSVYSEIAVKSNKLSGYVKPVASDIQIVSLKNDGNPVELAWESVVAFFVQLFKNQPKDQLATKVPLQGSLDNIEGSTWATILGIFRNAFVQAFTRATDNTIDFSNAGTQEKEKKN